MTKNIEARYKQALTFDEEENTKKNIQAEEDWKEKLKELKLMEQDPQSAQDGGIIIQ